MAPLTSQEREWVNAVINAAVAQAISEIKIEHAKLHEEFIRTLTQHTEKLSNETKEYVDRRIKEQKMVCFERQQTLVKSILAGGLGGVIVGLILDGHNIVNIIRTLIQAIF